MIEAEGELMVSELDRWRAAQPLVTAHGEKAEYQAGVHAAEFLKRGDQAGFNLWQDIALKIVRLQQKQLPAVAN